MNNIRAIIFDFDGVICDSVSVKSDAFYEIYKEFGKEIAKEVVKHHEANGGMTRFLKFRYYHKAFLNIELGEKEVNNLSERFSQLVLEKVVNSLFIPGAKEFLEENYSKYYFFISSGTPEEEIRIILRRKELNHYFQEAYGSPESKASHIRKILSKYQYDKESVIFVGDASADWQAAKETGIHFIGVENKRFKFDNTVLTINNLMNLCLYLDSKPN